MSFYSDAVETSKKYSECSVTKGMAFVAGAQYGFEYVLKLLKEGGEERVRAELYRSKENVHMPNGSTITLNTEEPEDRLRGIPLNRSSFSGICSAHRDGEDKGCRVCYPGAK
jgi:hypothetical protein